MKKKVGIIGTNGLPAKYGGFETLAEYLTRYLNEEFDLTIYCSKTAKKNRLNKYFNSNLIYIPLKANGWQSILYDSISIIHAFFFTDVLIVLGYTGVLTFPLKIIFKKKIILNIGGIEWQKVRGGKFLATIEVLTKKFLERISIYFSDIIIVDNQILWDYVKDNYNVVSVLIEYGGDHAIHKPITGRMINKYPFLINEYDISISRAQKDMNIDILIETYKKINDRVLVIISNWEISDYGMKLITYNKDKYPNIILLDAIYNLDELNILRSNAKIYFHSHSLCGTAPSLVEAMYLGLPAICYDVKTNRSTTEGKALYFKHSEELFNILSAIDEGKLISLSLAMEEIANRRYKWNIISKKYSELI